MECIVTFKSWLWSGHIHWLLHMDMLRRHRLLHMLDKHWWRRHRLLHMLDKRGWWWRRWRGNVAAQRVLDAARAGGHDVVLGSIIDWRIPVLAYHFDTIEIDPVWQLCLARPRELHAVQSLVGALHRGGEMRGVL